jgi:acyl-coenzyme A synthetase/AMP-(fatty) acid ligase/acyl carrier protein
LWTSVSFDVSVYEIFSALLFGRSLYLVPEDIRADGPQFVRWLSTHEITSAYMPPFQLADLAFWLQSQPAEPLPLRRLLVGVEPINELLLATIQHHLPDLQIINGYGPTEATVCATLHPVSSQQAQNRNTPLGQPVQNMQVYLLNECLDQVAPGETGEVYIGGPGLARGYLNRPDLTAERFIPNPFSTTPGARLYQTGDLARRLPDGTLAFVGRADQQVKIRGFRIELGEIEEILQQHPAVQRSAVVLRKERPDTSRLVGYITPNPGCTPDPHELQRFLTTKLPLHMVPALLMVIKQMPLLPNGKCDRNALPAPEAICPPVERVLTAPQDALEQRIAAMWASVLHVEQVGRDDDFLKLGGDSLAAMQIRSRLQSAFHVEIPFESILFSFSTVASLAEQIRQL